MEKKVKNLYDLSCNWYISNLKDEDMSLPMFLSGAWAEDQEGNIHNSFSGKFVSFDDNSIVGYAYDGKREKINQLIIGLIVDGKAVSFCKIYDDDFISNPTYFQVFANSFARNRGLNDSYYGEMYTKGMIDFKRVGDTSIKATKKQRDEAEIEKVIKIYNELRNKIKAEGFTSYFALEDAEDLNPAEMTKYISKFAEGFFDIELPPVLQEEICSIQPGNE